MFSFSKIFLKQNHMLSQHIIHLRVFPLCFLTLISQTKLDMWKASWEATQPQPLGSGTCGMHSFGCFSFLFLYLPTTPSLTVSNVYTFSPLSSPAGKNLCCFPLPLQLAWTHISETRIPEYSCHSPEPSLDQNPTPAVCQFHPKRGVGCDTEQHVNVKTGTCD